MRWSMIKSLIRLNLVYSTDTATVDRIRKKQRENPNLSMSMRLIRTQLIVGTLFAAVFGIMLMFIDMKKNPEQFGIYGFFFVMVTFLQSFLVIFNVFYESRDMEGYRHIPVTTAEVILGKSVTVIMGTFFYLFPLIVIFFVMPFKAAPNIPLAVCFALTNTVLIPTGVLISAFVLINIIGATSVFQRHKKGVSAVLTGIVSMILGISFLALNPQLFIYDLLKNHTGLFEPYIKLLEFEASPTIKGAAVTLGPWLLISIFGILYTRKVILTNLYEQVSGSQSQNAGGKKHKLKAANEDTLKQEKNLKNMKQGFWKGRSLKRLLFKYNLGLLLDTTVLFQFLITPQIIMPLVMSSSIYQTSKYMNGIAIDWQYSIVAVVTGIFYAFMTSGMLHFIIISLDRENFNFIKSLPMDFSEYIMYKFRFAFVVQDIIPMAFIIGICVWLRIPYYIMLMVSLSFLFTALLICHRDFKSDYRHLDLDWQSVTQLANRGGSNIKKVLIFFLVIFLGTLFTVISYFMSKEMSLELVRTISVLMLILLALISLSYHRMEVRFWKSQS